ncbi:MAG TPA: hypothetical protein VGK29_13580 [Paludibaculum sp.]|jgi:hypothetical protein
MAQDLNCVVSFPKLQLIAVRAAVNTFDRRGAVIQVLMGDLQGRTIKARESVLLEVGLPLSPKFGRRAMHCTGVATHVSESIDGSLWLTVRFRQLHFQPVGPASVHAGNSVPLSEDNRGQKAGGTVNGAVNGALNS